MSEFSFFKTSLLLIGICVCLSYLFLKYLRDRRRLHHYGNTIKGPLALPIIGSAYVFWGNTQSVAFDEESMLFRLIFFSDVMESLLRLNAKYGQIFKVWIGNHLTFFASNPEAVQVILNAALDKVPTYQFMAPAFGKGLLTLPAAEWKSHRKLINVTFNQRILNSFVTTFSNYSNILVGKLEGALGKGYVDVFPILTQCTVDIVSDTTMGVKLDIMKKDGHSLIPWTGRLSELGTLRMSNPLFQKDFIWRLTSKSKEMQILSHKVNNYIEQIVSTKRTERSLQNRNYDTYSQKPILLDHLLKLEEKETVWNQQNSVQESLTILVAGSDATALMTGYVLMMLGMHPDIQTRTYQELISVFGESNRDVSVEDLQNLCYLERVVKETLRLFPVGSVFGRQLYEDVVLDNYTLPKGSSVYILPIAIHRDPTLWPEPLKFDPDRFLAEEIAKRHPCAYIPFSTGPRNCLGFRYAMMAMKTILATILRHYKVVEAEYKEVKAVKLKVDVATKCVGGQKVHLEKRL